MPHITVKSPDGEYLIGIYPGVYAEQAFTPANEEQRHLKRHLEAAKPTAAQSGAKTVIVTNTTLAPLYGQALMNSYANASLAIMPDGESYKTLDTVAQLYADFVAAGLDRGGTVVALGGGVVGDVAGFAAATYMRGVRLVQMPTSLLAMVDSSVGGKVGVDLPQGKNLVGAFKQPAMVIIDPQFLRTLPLREWRCGMAEVIKHGLLADRILLDQIEALGAWGETAPALAEDELADLIARAVQVKVDVVQRDPFEKGERAHLNLGHTFAHAIEQASGYQWLHGEAVAVGLVAAARLSAALDRCDSSLPEEVEDIV
ncbi:MAG: 3-dehydroquinate synthase, partial [Anaerolineae bacterium]|nr:3-dehydroquinate synthase [Anaerolineae bacterium]